MKTTIDFKNKLTMISEMTNESRFQVLEFEKLQGGLEINSSLKIQSINNTGMRLRQVRIILKESAIKLVQGGLSYLKGDIDIKEKKRLNSRNKSIGQKILSGMLLDKEEDSLNLYYGTGEIFLEPSFNNYVIIKLEEEEVIVNEEIFLACEGNIDIQELNGEIRLSGEGIAVLELPVPEGEVFKCKLFHDRLKVDGNLVVLRNGDINLVREKLNLSTSEDGQVSILNVYEGIGELWLIPTRNIYEDISDQF